MLFLLSGMFTAPPTRQANFISFLKIQLNHHYLRKFFLDVSD